MYIFIKKKTTKDHVIGCTQQSWNQKIISNFPLIVTNQWLKVNDKSLPEFNIFMIIFFPIFIQGMDENNEYVNDITIALPLSHFEKKNIKLQHHRITSK